MLSRGSVCGEFTGGSGLFFYRLYFALVCSPPEKIPSSLRHRHDVVPIKRRFKSSIISSLSSSSWLPHHSHTARRRALGVVVSLCSLLLFESVTNLFSQSIERRPHQVWRVDLRQRRMAFSVSTPFNFFFSYGKDLFAMI